MTDPYDCAGIRARVLAGWAAAPVRFREDANAEEDLVLGGYRDRLVVELAQNAADAAARAGVPGRLLLHLSGNRLVAANTGAPLTAAGVQALSTLRASAKRDGDTVGRFGVGFAAVLAVTDEPVVVSGVGAGAGAGARSGAGAGTAAVCWSRARTAALVGELPALREEVAARGGSVPVLRLPFAVDGAAAGVQLEVPPGYDTAVVLPLRDPRAAAEAADQLAGVDGTLLLALTGLTEIVVETGQGRRRLAADRSPAMTVIDDGGTVTRWQVHSATGPVPAELLADRPVEERSRTRWAVTAALPVDAAGAPLPLPASVAPVLRAPTPTDEPVGLPAVLIGTLPLDPDRRHAAPGPLRDLVLAELAGAYAGLVRSLAPVPAVLRCVPVGLAAGELDGRLRPVVLERLAETAFLPAAADPELRLRPRDAVVLDLPAAAVAALAPVLPGLLPAGWSGTALRALGVRELPLADLVESLAGLDREPGWWRELYVALEPLAGGPDRDALAALPVPLADGRMVTGVRGLLLPGPGVPAEVVGVLGLRVVHPDAVAPLLGRLGATEVTARSLLDLPAVRSAVEASYDEEDPAALADAVLTLVHTAGIGAGEVPELAELALPGEDGEWYPAGELLLPGSAAVELFAADAPFGVAAADLLGRWGPEVLAAAGVLTGPAVLRVPDAALEPVHDLDGEDDWVEHCERLLPPGQPPPVLEELVAVRDLELIAPDAWPVALRLLTEPPLRDLWAAPVRVSGIELPSYTRWWLSTHPVLPGGLRPVDARVPGSDALLAGLYDPGTGDPRLLAQLGARATLADALEDPQDLLDRLADPARVVDRQQLRSVYAALAVSGAQLAPAAVRAVRAGSVQVVPAQDAVVVDAPDLLPVLDAAVVPAPLPLAVDLAEVLDLPLASELFDAGPDGAGVERAVPPAVAELPGVPASYVEHAPLTCAGRALPWRVLDGVPHLDAAAGPEPLARAFAWAAGRWADRLLIAALLSAGSDEREALLAEADLDGPG